MSSLALNTTTHTITLAAGIVQDVEEFLKILLYSVVAFSNIFYKKFVFILFTPSHIVQIFLNKIIYKDSVNPWVDAEAISSLGQKQRSIMSSFCPILTVSVY